MHRKGVQCASGKWGELTAVKQIKFIAIGFKNFSNSVALVRVVANVKNFNDHDGRPPLISKDSAPSSQYAELGALHIHFQNIDFRIGGDQVIQRVGRERHRKFLASVND